MANGLKKLFNKPTQKELDDFVEITASCGNDDGVAEFLDKYPAAVNEKSALDTMGDTALTMAASYNHARTVKLLLERGADVNEKNGYGDIALIYAAMRGYRDIVEILLENGADINAKRQQDGTTALIVARERGQTETVALLTEWANKQHAQWLKDTDFSSGLKNPIPIPRPFKLPSRKV